ncbi:MAG: hypothetical protein AAF656_03835 [Planctomycetota bacterium]
MPDTWTQVSRDSQSAAIEALDRRRWRTSVSRSYFAVYAAVTAVAVDRRVEFASDREGPEHRQLVGIVLRNLGLGDNAGDVVGLATQLYQLRLRADYRPSSVIGAAEAQSAVSMMRKAANLLEVNP